jgi:predicted Zn-dependent protease
VAAAMVLFALFSYFNSVQTNPVTGEEQRVALSINEEIALGLQSAPRMARQHGGLSNDTAAAQRVSQIGNQILRAVANSEIPYTFQFHLLADSTTVNAFALPGGQVFITEALYRALRTDGEVAGVLGHEIGHVLERHGAEHLAKQNLTNGLVGAVAAASDPYSSEGKTSQILSRAIAQLVNMKFGRSDELESDRWGVKLLQNAGYDPRALIGVMDVLEKSASPGRAPEFFSTHPNPENRRDTIQQAIRDQNPNGLPRGLSP